MNFKGFGYGICLFVILSSISTLFGCSGKPFRSSRTGLLSASLKVGMTQGEVEKQLGKPMGFHRRRLSPDDLREIWVYHVKNRDPRNHLYPNIHLYVFSNGKMIAKDPHDPYALLENY